MSFLKSSAWRRLRKNKSAVVGMITIIVAVFAAIFCYFLAPDISPNANRIILEIGGETPGFEKQFLRVKRDRRIESTNVLQQLLSGKPDAYTLIPINEFRIKGDSISAEKYVDEGVSESIAFNKTQLAEDPVVVKKFWLGTELWS